MVFKKVSRKVCKYCNLLNMEPNFQQCGDYRKVLLQYCLWLVLFCCIQSFLERLFLKYQVQSEQINSLLLENNDQQSTENSLLKADVTIQPYPSLESWVDVPLKKLGIKGKIQGYTPWKQDMDLTETEEEDDSIDDERELQNGQMLSEFSNSNKFSQEDLKVKRITP
eukprot:TRINITY_DN18775_c1_g1_i2.p2 TRINITY_DN18775_c1_g1~~TRINITY_DN18775_c1_g1_i2.p2  ORF type:complete len:167 (-),score=12.00 TRINITY_DN18775_c1_g1_i2:24-524(-)